MERHFKKLTSSRSKLSTSDGELPVSSSPLITSSLDLKVSIKSERRGTPFPQGKVSAKSPRLNIFLEKFSSARSLS